MAARILIAGFLVLWVGCGKPSAPPPAEPKVETTAPPAEPSPAPPTAAAPAASATDEAQMTALLSELTQVVRKYSVERRSAPKTLDELVAQGYLARVPEAPSGKRFSISKDLRVQLVNR
jgi:hypothetical protein